MKKLFLILMLACIGLASTNAQVRKGTLTAVSAEGADTTNTTELSISGSWDCVAYQVLCTETGGDSDGTMWPEASIDGDNFFKLSNLANNPWIELNVSDTTALAVNDFIVTISDGLTVALTVKSGSPYAAYRFGVISTVGDTTLLTPSYRVQK